MRNVCDVTDRSEQGCAGSVEREPGPRGHGVQEWITNLCRIIKIVSELCVEVNEKA
jgi:hypothetical protein